MKFKYLGTGAAEGVPALFCACEVCERSRTAGGRNLRTRSQAIIDDRILLDFPPDTYAHVLMQGLDLLPVRSCLITHGHADHLYAVDFEMRKNGFAHFPEGNPPLMTVFASKKSGKGIAAVLKEKAVPNDNVRLQTVEPFEPFAVERYQVVAYKADHAKDLDPLFYSVSDGEKTVLYANDTGYFPEATWRYMKKSGLRFDFVSLDCTGSLVGYRSNHMSVVTCKEVRERLIKIGCADANTQFCLHHFSHNGLASYDDLFREVENEGFLVSYDGMEITL